MQLVREAESEPKDRRACLSLGLSQPTVSHHLRKLVEAGLLEKTRAGRTVTHRVRPELFAELRTVLQMD